MKQISGIVIIPFMLCITKKWGFLCSRSVSIFCNMKSFTTFFHEKLAHVQSRMAKFVMLWIVKWYDKESWTKLVTEPVPDWVTEPAPSDKNCSISFFTGKLGPHGHNNAQHDSPDIFNYLKQKQNIHQLIQRVTKQPLVHFRNFGCPKQKHAFLILTKFWS